MTFRRKHVTRRRRFWILGIGTAALALVAATAVLAALRGERGRIAFDDGRTFPSLIGSMNPDGSDVQILSENGDHWPRWSPGGAKIVFFSTRTPNGSDDGDAEIFVMNADGSDQTQLTFNDVRDEVPTWTPDGRIVWSQRTGVGQWDLWIMNADGSNQHQLTSLDGAELWPSVSPQGNRLAFAANYLDGRLHIFTMRLDGTDIRQVTSSDLEDWAPDWSPTGNDIVFTREYPAPDTSAGVDENLFIVHADGTNLRQITDRPDRVEIFPVWAPDGKALLYPAITDWFGPNWDTWLTVYDLKSGTETTVGEDNRGGAPSWQALPHGGSG
jgi:Tol biopolymer transport system component